MTEADYVYILVDGIANNREFLSEHFYRESKKAEKDHISPPEFFKRLLAENEVFLNELKRKNHEDQRTWSLAKSQYLSEGKPWDEDLERAKPSLV